MLINLSNHPCDKWSQNQVDKAKELFGEVIDLPFPNVPPDASEQQVLEMAHQYLQKILQIRNNIPSDESLSVHVMGEFNFTFIIVQLLTKHNIPCYASTTVREVILEKTENNEVVKTNVFKFVQFRRYMTI